MRWTRTIGVVAVAAALVPPMTPARPSDGPAFALVAAARPIGRGDSYTVAQGDTLGAIAARAGVRVADLVAANAIANPNLIRTGTVLHIPKGPVPRPKTEPTPASGASTPTLRLGSSGLSVGELQRRLTLAGHRVATDLRFGPKTQAAVTAFQRAKGLAADGIVGPRTWAALGITPSTTDTRGGPPTTRTTTTVPPAAGPWKIFGASSYTAKQGDTWTSVAKIKGTTAAALATANRRAQTERLKAGTVLSVPGPWRCPVPGGSFINDWGFPRSGGRTHKGNDLFAPRGRPVQAPVAGTAVRSPNGLGGNAVQLQGDDGVRYYFAHLDGYANLGRVSAGTIIGTVGNSGAAITTITHLHFEVHPGGGEAVNPFPTLTLACRR